MKVAEKQILDSFKQIPITEVDSYCGNHKLHFSMESFNIAGSIKDKNAYYLIKQAEARGTISPGGTIIESSSGNLGIAFAVIGKRLGYKVHIVIDQKTSLTMRKLLKLYGAQISEVPRESCDQAGSMQKARMEFAKRLQLQIPNSWYACQHLNPDTADAHYHLTAPVIEKKLNCVPDAIFIGVSTAGQLAGLSRYFKRKYPYVTIVAVDIKGSGVFTHKRSPYKITGLGLSFTPPAFKWSLVDRAYQVSDDLTISACHYLTNKHGLFLGASSGSLYSAAQLWLKEQKAPRNICLISSDGGERYLDTIYSEDWIKQNHISLVAEDQLHFNFDGVTEYKQAQTFIAPATI